MVSGIVLAAGESSRMGSVKALIDYRDKTFIETIVDNLKKSRAGEIIVVLGFHEEKIKAAIKKEKVIFTVNQRPQLGQLASLKAGIKKVSRKSSGALIALVDQPAVKTQTYKKLIDRAEKAPDKIIIPSHNGKHGHPFIIPGKLFKSLLNFSTKFTTRDFIILAGKSIKSNSNLISYLSVNDPGILKNYNCKVDLPENQLIEKHNWG